MGGCMMGGWKPLPEGFAGRTCLVWLRTRSEHQHTAHPALARVELQNPSRKAKGMRQADQT